MRDLNIGMAVVHGIIENHDTVILMESEYDNCGTSQIFFLNAMEKFGLNRKYRPGIPIVIRTESSERMFEKKTRQMGVRNY